MKRIFNTVLLSASVIILLLHSFVPHHHSVEGFNLKEILQHEPVQSPIDLLKVGFHINLGANHLENFQKSKSLESEKKIADEEISSLDFFKSSDKSHYSFSLNYRNSFFTGQHVRLQSQFKNTFNYRGPPVFA